ncbi:membrane protein [Escherichia coli]|nr:membrane protein [Escherichia coli]AHM46615.1 membrane protein [Escherichia coli]AHM51170.1 membrane protein [Escherichia coli]KDW71512.1 putative membrane protein [Escherichia coli 1-392-07_S1_C1]
MCLILGNIWLPYFIWLFYVAIKYLIIEVNYQKTLIIKI